MPARRQQQPTLCTAFQHHLWHTASAFVFSMLIWCCQAPSGVVLHLAELLSGDLALQCISLETNGVTLSEHCGCDELGACRAILSSIVDSEAPRLHVVPTHIEVVFSVQQAQAMNV